MNGALVSGPLALFDAAAFRLGRLLKLHRSLLTVHCSLSHPTTLSTSANAKTVTLITPFIVKNAESSRERSPGLTS